MASDGSAPICVLMAKTYSSKDALPTTLSPGLEGKPDQYFLNYAEALRDIQTLSEEDGYVSTIGHDSAGEPIGVTTWNEEYNAGWAWWIETGVRKGQHGLKKEVHLEFIEKLAGDRESDRESD